MDESLRDTADKYRELKTSLDQAVKTIASWVKQYTGRFKVAKESLEVSCR